MERKWGRGQAQGPINFNSMPVAFNWVHLRRPEVADGERWEGRWSPGEAGVVGQHQLIFLALLGLSQQDSGGSLFPSSFLEWEQLNKGDPFETGVCSVKSAHRSRYEGQLRNVN